MHAWTEFLVFRCNSAFKDRNPYTRTQNMARNRFNDNQPTACSTLCYSFSENILFSVRLCFFCISVYGVDGWLNFCAACVIFVLLILHLIFSFHFRENKSQRSAQRTVERNEASIVRCIYNTHITFALARI